MQPQCLLEALVTHAIVQVQSGACCRRALQTMVEHKLRDTRLFVMWTECRRRPGRRARRCESSLLSFLTGHPRTLNPRYGTPLHSSRPRATPQLFYTFCNAQPLTSRLGSAVLPPDMRPGSRPAPWLTWWRSDQYTDRAGGGRHLDTMYSTGAVLAGLDKEASNDRPIGDKTA